MYSKTNDYTSQRNIPEGSTPITRSDVPNAIAYTFCNSISGQLLAKGFIGKAGKPAFYYSYSSEQKRAEALTRFFDNQKRINDTKAQQRQKRTEYCHSIKVGDIFDNSWGYDQTNVDFYQVVAVPSPKTVVIRPISSQHAPSDYKTSSMAGHVVALANNFTGPEQTKHPYGHDGKDYLPMEFGSCSKWNGQPQYESWYA